MEDNSNACVCLYRSPKLDASDFVVVWLNTDYMLLFNFKMYLLGKIFSKFHFHKIEVSITVTIA